MIIWHEQVYKDVLNEIFNNNFGDEDTSGDEDEKGASSLLRGLESAKKNLILILRDKVWRNYVCVHLFKNKYLI